MKLNVTVNGRRYEVDVEIAGSQRAALAPRAIKPAKFQPPANGSSTVNGDRTCRSPMAGVVIRVNAQPGQEIQENDLLIVLEAMKMETNITAPVSGRIKTVAVAAGDAVQVGETLVEFEQDPSMSS